MIEITKLIAAAADRTVRRASSMAGVDSYACFSPCERYRYVLVREWNDALPRVAFCGLNPSTADERKNDPTVARCVNYARKWGFGSMAMLNLFAFRATQPAAMKGEVDPIGAPNDHFLQLYSGRAELTLACWGVHGAFLDRASQARPLLRRLHHLGLTKAGQPRHPLYLRGDLCPLPWPEGD